METTNTTECPDCYGSGISHDCWDSPGRCDCRRRCGACLGDGAMEAEHLSDEDCAGHIDADGQCSVCGVDHSGECGACGGRGFHRGGCEAVA